MCYCRIGIEFIPCRKVVWRLGHGYTTSNIIGTRNPAEIPVLIIPGVFVARLCWHITKTQVEIKHWGSWADYHQQLFYYWILFQESSVSNQLWTFVLLQFAFKYLAYCVVISISNHFVTDFGRKTAAITDRIDPWISAKRVFNLNGIDVFALPFRDTVSCKREVQISILSLWRRIQLINRPTLNTHPMNIRGNDYLPHRPVTIAYFVQI